MIRKRMRMRMRMRMKMKMKMRVPPLDLTVRLVHYIKDRIGRHGLAHVERRAAP